MHGVGELRLADFRVASFMTILKIASVFSQRNCFLSGVPQQVPGRIILLTTVDLARPAFSRGQRLRIMSLIYAHCPFSSHNSFTRLLLLITLSIGKKSEAPRCKLQVKLKPYSVGF